MTASSVLRLNWIDSCFRYLEIVFSQLKLVTIQYTVIDTE